MTTKSRTEIVNGVLYCDEIRIASGKFEVANVRKCYDDIQQTSSPPFIEYEEGGKFDVISGLENLSDHMTANLHLNDGRKFKILINIVRVHGTVFGYTYAILARLE